MSKLIVYQIFTRLYGNTCTERKHNGTIAQNGCGKFNDINDAALSSIAQMGFSHVWYTGIIRHASATHYPYFSHPSNANVVKGKAGSPYAICDYYDVDPDLAQDVAHRLDEFAALIERTHAHGLKCVIDFVPNHVARNYYSDVMPDKPQLGGTDDQSQYFSPQNNFYYLGEPFVSPVSDLDVPYAEEPARASGNDAFTPRPSICDWYETVKLNYGRSYPDGYVHTQPIPDTWFKMRDILLYWASMGIDGFRVDMAEMVPVEFWQWVIRQIVARYPRVTFIAETYDVSQYRSYIEAGFNYLYDKVNFYDTVRDVICSRRSAADITNIWRTTEGLGRNMLYFLENHDEQRIASHFFASDPIKARPAMALTALMGAGGAMVYFGQEIGEPGMDAEGFSGADGRTTIFDYWGIERFQQYVGNHTYTGEALPREARELRTWYQQLLCTTQSHEALSTGHFYDLMWVNQDTVDTRHIYAFLRYAEGQRYMVVANFADEVRSQRIRISADAWQLMGLSADESIMPTIVFGHAETEPATSRRKIENEGIEISLGAHDAIVLKL